jgi:hypothetical protein
MVTPRSPQHLHHRPNRLTITITTLTTLLLLSSCGEGERGATVNETDDYVAILDMRPQYGPNGGGDSGNVIPPRVGLVGDEDSGERYPEFCWPVKLVAVRSESDDPTLPKNQIIPKRPLMSPEIVNGQMCSTGKPRTVTIRYQTP